MTAVIVRDITRLSNQEAVPEGARETLIAPLADPMTLKVGATYRVKPVPNYKLNKNSHPSISVQFGEKGILEHKAVDITLEESYWAVQKLIEDSYIFFT